MPMLPDQRNSTMPSLPQWALNLVLRNKTEPPRSVNPHSWPSVSFITGKYSIQGDCGR